MAYGIQDIARNSLGLSARSETLRDKEFWAVNDVSFELKRGETLGLIGANGAGKTTMLKMLNGIFWPDKGQIAVKGKVGALIEVGAGFHPSLTGRENVYINGAILGMAKAEIDEQFDAIVDFADIGDFIDSPVKYYSSGMFVRLGFSIAVHCRLDILLVDEVLAVGDRNFQLKCFKKMHELKNNQNMAIVMVSHNEYVMREYTQTCVLFDKGKNMFNGPSEDAVSLYINTMTREKEMLAEVEGSLHDKGIIKEVIFKDHGGKAVNTVNTGSSLTVDFKYDTKDLIKKPIFGISLYNTWGMFTGFWNSYENVELPDIKGSGTVRVTIDPFDVPFDSYHCAVVLCEEEESNVIEWKNLDQKIIVDRPNNTRGYLKLRQTWEMVK